MEKIDKLIKRHAKAKQALNEYHSVLQDAYTYALPDKGYFSTLSGGKRTTKIFDSTAILGLGTYADKVQQNLVPPWRKWFMLVPGSEIPEEIEEQVQPLLDEITETLYDHINHSNFNTKINEALQDVGISTGIITCEEGDGIESSLVFNSIPIEEVALEQSESGVIENVFRQFKIKIREIESTIIGAKLTPELAKKLEKDDNAIVKLTEAIIKNKDKKYEHTIFYEEDKEIVYDVIDDSSPYVVFRERVASKGVYGMGRIIQLLYDIKVLNKICEMDLQNAGLAISGVWTATDDGVLNPYNVQLVPGTVIPVASNASNAPSLRALERGGDFNIAQIKIEQKQELITKTLFGQALGSVTRTPVRSATEVNERTGETFEMTSAAFSRFQTELLERLIKRMVDVLQKAGKIAPIVIDGKEVTVKFTSPMAKQQDQQDIGVVTSYANTLAMTGIPPQELARHIKFEKVPMYIAENLGFPIKLMRTEEERNIYDMQQAQAMQAQAQMQQQGGDNVQ
jgi:hypothetical protein